MNGAAVGWMLRRDVQIKVTFVDKNCVTRPKFARTWPCVGLGLVNSTRGDEVRKDERQEGTTWSNLN